MEIEIRRPWRDSNSRPWLRRPIPYPLGYRDSSYRFGYQNAKSIIPTIFFLSRLKNSSKEQIAIFTLIGKDSVLPLDRNIYRERGVFQLHLLPSLFLDQKKKASYEQALTVLDFDLNQLLYRESQ